MLHTTILLIEDDAELAALIGDFLRKHDYAVVTHDDGVGAVEKIVELKPTLVILDVMLPGKTGMDVCREAREVYEGPIIMFTALDDDIDQMLGLELGADDYVVKPVQPRLLLSRIRAVLRRFQVGDSHSNAIQDRVIKAGDLEVNLADLTVSLSGKPISMTNAEFDLLVLLANQAGSVVDRNSIVKELRGFEYDGLDRSIDRRISRLRKKLETANGDSLIKTIRGKGYQLCVHIDDLGNL